MAEKTTAGYLPEVTPEAARANVAYQQALNRMQQALDARQGRFFDPELLAIAQGFLTPGQTGSFGEGLGFAAGNLRQAQAQQEKEEREIAQAQLGLATQGLELERQRGRERTAREMFGLGPTTPGAPAGGLPTSGPRGPLSSPAAPPGFSVSMGVRTMEPNPAFENRRNQYIQAAIARGTDPADIIKDLAKLDENRFIKSESGIQDLGSGLFFHTSTKLEPKQVFTRDGKEVEIRVTPGQAAKLDELAGAGNPAYYDFLDRIRQAPPRTRAEPGKPGEPGKAEGEPEGRPATMRSTEELEQDRQYRAQRGQLSAKEQSDEAQNWYKRGNDSSSLIDDIRVIQGIFDPRNKYSKVLTGVFERGDIGSQVGTLIESGILGESLKESARKIATNAGLKDDAITQFQVAVSRMADLKLKASRIMEGQGTITEAERRLIAESVINITDTPKTVLAKAEYLAARARFETQRAEMLREFRDDRRDYNDFVRSKEYKELKKNYENELERIVERRLKIKLPPRTPPTAGGRDNEGAANRLPESVR